MFLLRYAAAILTVLAGRLTAAENCGMLLAAMWVQSGVAGDFDELWREQCADHGAARPGRAQRCPDAAEASGCGSIRALTRRCGAPLCSLCAGCRRSTRSLCACRSMCGRPSGFCAGMAIWPAGHFLAPSDPEQEPYIRLAVGDYLQLLAAWGQDSALASILRSLAHELTHYFQWVRDPVGIRLRTSPDWSGRRIAAPARPYTITRMCMRIREVHISF